MHPALSIVFFTTASGAGFSLFLLLRLGGALDHDFVPLLRDRSERPVGTDDVQGVEARVHDLPP